MLRYWPHLLTMCLDELRHTLIYNDKQFTIILASINKVHKVHVGLYMLVDNGRGLELVWIYYYF